MPSHVLSFLESGKKTPVKNVFDLVMWDIIFTSLHTFYSRNQKHERFIDSDLSPSERRASEI